MKVVLNTMVTTCVTRTSRIVDDIEDQANG